MQWMKDVDHHKHGTLPEFDLNTKLPYYGRGAMPGNHAGGMPWDSTCNKDHDDIVLRHVAATNRLLYSDPRKFSLRTPKEVSYAYRRIYNNPVVKRDGVPLMDITEGGPPPHRLGHDIMQVPEYWKSVFENEGRNVGKNADGHRGDDGRREKRKKRGGKRRRRVREDATLESWWHPDAREAVDSVLRLSQRRFVAGTCRSHVFLLSDL